MNEGAAEVWGRWGGISASRDHRPTSSAAPGVGLGAAQPTVTTGG